MGRLTERDGVHHRDIVYQPLPSQRDFHKSNARFKGFSGPIGSGKSQALCHEAIRLSYINAGRTGLIGAPTYPMLRDATQAAFVETLELNGLPYSFNKSDGVLTMRDSGSQILFRAMDEFERLRGTNIAWFGLDELTYTREEAWLRLEGRLRDAKAKRLCGFAVWTPKGFDWVYRKFIEGNAAERYDVVRAGAFENRHILDAIPDYYERLKGSYDESFFLQEVMGEYLNANGKRVYAPFDIKQHVKALKPLPYLPICWALDFNVNPLCSVVAQVDGDTVRVLDEVVLNGACTQEACDEFSKRYGGHFAGYSIYGDASGQARSTKGSSDYDIVTTHFKTHRERMTFEVPKHNPFVRDRVQAVNGKLKSAAGEVRLEIDPKCKELIKDLEQVSYKEDGQEIDKNKDKKRTHSSDALGYLIYSVRKAAVTFGEQSNRIL